MAKIVTPSSKGETLTTRRHGTPHGRTASAIRPIGRNNGRSTLIVLVPGLAGNDKQWDLVRPKLADLPVDLAYGAPLLPGPVFRGARPMASLLGDAYVEELSRENRRDVIIVAHSVGTFVALDVARKLPGLVKQVIAVNGGLTTPARFLDRPVRTFRERPRECLNALRLFALVGIPTLPAVRRAIAGSERLSRAVFGFLVSDAALKSAERRGILADEGGKPKAMLTLWYNRHHWHKFPDHAREIKPRCLFLAGEQDPVAGVTNTEAMAGLLPNEKVTSLSGVGHAAPVENPEAVSAAIHESVYALRGANLLGPEKGTGLQG